jgi:hypothetical protein
MSLQYDTLYVHGHGKGTFYTNYNKEKMCAVPERVWGKVAQVYYFPYKQSNHGYPDSGSPLYNWQSLLLAKVF